MEFMSYETRRRLRLAKLEEVVNTDYLETVMRDIGFDDTLKRFDRIARCVRILAVHGELQRERITAIKLYEMLAEETGEAPRWIDKQITLAVKDAFKSGKILCMNTYARYNVVQSDVPIGNFAMISELSRILMLRAIELVNQSC